MSDDPIVIIGAGIGGLSTAVRLAAAGQKVCIYEKNTTVGGKMSQITADGYRFDTGPSVITMRHVFEDLFHSAGRNLADYLTLCPVDPLTRYFYQDNTVLDMRRDLSDTLQQIEALDPRDVEGYLLPYAPGNNYPWGSNSSIVNNMIILAYAHDFTGAETYFNAISEGQDYLLGRNPMDQSYVAGYGERPLQNPHHRFWAKQLVDTFPPPYPGAMSGGPNSGLEDPLANGLLAGCPAQKCFVDHIESWSTNEITINWNAPFAWVTAFLDEQASPEPEWSWYVFLPTVSRD